ncbi:hypothetical protein [Rubritalea tangerina]|uniref:hypothetical protein n=1 Tax=Rubritalea tangerina TaxID=430798 RepID=UPI0036126D2D
MKHFCQGPSSRDLQGLRLVAGQKRQRCLLAQHSKLERDGLNHHNSLDHKFAP